jgi:hypothetical protein
MQEHKTFDVRYESATHDSRYWSGTTPESNIMDPRYKHLVLKEVFYGRESLIKTDWLDYIKYCDKTVFLYREDEQDQIISWNHARVTENFCCQYPAGTTRLVKQHVDYFTKLKKKYTEYRLEHKDKGLTISYEDLYYRNKIHILKEYLGLEDELTLNFPIGQRYRYEKEKQDPKKLI